MKKIKYLILLFAITLTLSLNNVNATLYTAYTLQNKLVPGFGYGLQTGTVYFDEYTIGYHRVSNVDITRTLEATLYKTGPNTTGNADTVDVRDGVTTDLTNHTTAHSIYNLAVGNFHVIFRSKLYHVGDTTINNINWQTYD